MVIDLGRYREYLMKNWHIDEMVEKSELSEIYEKTPLLKAGDELGY